MMSQVEQPAEEDCKTAPVYTVAKLKDEKASGVQPSQGSSHCAQYAEIGIPLPMLCIPEPPEQPDQKLDQALAKVVMACFWKLGLGNPHLLSGCVIGPRTFPLENSINPKACREVSSSSGTMLSVIVMVEWSAINRWAI